MLFRSGEVAPVRVRVPEPPVEDKYRAREALLDTGGRPEAPVGRVGSNGCPEPERAHGADEQSKRGEHDGRHVLTRIGADGLPL